MASYSIRKSFVSIWHWQGNNNFIQKLIEHTNRNKGESRTTWTQSLTQVNISINPIFKDETMMSIKVWSPNFRKENCKRILLEPINIEPSAQNLRCIYICEQNANSPFDIGRIKSSRSLSSMISMPKSSRTAPYLFIVFGLMILNFVSWTHFSKFST